jgi:hypothetical protein
MPFDALLSIVGSVLLALGGGVAVVWALSKYLGGIWASRILEQERASIAREHELLVRRRDVYAKLAQSLRVFLLRSGDPMAPEDCRAFLAAYDEAALWASEPVVDAVRVFLDLNAKNTASPGTVNEEDHEAAYADCISAMRRDSGFPRTTYRHQVVGF